MLQSSVVRLAIKQLALARTSFYSFCVRVAPPRCGSVELGHELSYPFRLVPVQPPIAFYAYRR